MKKFLVFFVFNTCFVIAQTKLVSHHLDLKKSNSYHKILNAVNPDTKEVFVFAADKENVNVQKYNSALFFSDSLISELPDSAYPNMVGYEFKDHTASIYWASSRLKKILAVAYDFRNRTVTNVPFELQFKDESIIDYFSENNTFYIISEIKLENKLKLYLFKNGKYEEKTIDFSAFNFSTDKGKSLKFNEIISENPLLRIDADVWNSVVTASANSKLYVTEDKLIISFDYSQSKTQFLEIDLSTFTIKEKTFQKPTLDQPGTSNSFLYDNKVFQMKANSEQLSWDVKDYESGEILKTTIVSKNDVITFKNSPLYSQTGRQRLKEFKNTEKFLKKLNQSQVGITAYKVQDELLVTIGGSQNVASAGGILLGATILAAEVMSGSGGFSEGFFDSDNLQVIYFDTLFNDDFQQVEGQLQPLANDFISGFVSETKDISLGNTFRYNDFYIFGYYNSKEKEYVMRKFEDGFSQSNQPFLENKPAK